MEDVSCWERNFALIVFFSLKKMSKRLKITFKKEILVFHIITVYEVTMALVELSRCQENVTTWT